MDKLEDLKVYRIAEELCDNVWDVVTNWDWFAKKTVGSQLVEAADSVAANIAEGHGRYHYKENRLFCFYTRGSYMETRNWLRRATKRNLLTQQQKETIKELTDRLGPKLNAYIRSIGTKSARNNDKTTNA